MMEAGLPGAYDNLMSNGVVDFDPEAFIKRGEAVPSTAAPVYLPFEQPLLMPEMPKMHVQPHEDEFKKEKEEPKEEHKTNWKKTLTLAVLGAAAAVGGYKTYKFLKRAPQQIQQAANAPTSNIFKRAWGWIKSPFAKKVAQP